MFLWNFVFCFIPSYSVRKFILTKLYRAKVGKSNIHIGVRFFSPWKLVVGDNSNIQMCSFLDCRGGIVIGNNVDITIGAKVLTQYHDIDSPLYETITKPVVIEDYCIVSSFSTILPGVVLSKGAVLGASSVLTKSTLPYSLYVGAPAEFRRARNTHLIYNPNYKRPFH